MNSRAYNKRVVLSLHLSTFRRADNSVLVFLSCHSNNAIWVVAQAPWYKKAVYWICGIENMDSSSHESQAVPSDADMSIEEDPFWSSIINTSAVLLMIGAAFMWGFYA